MIFDRALRATAKSAAPVQSGGYGTTLTLGSTDGWETGGDDAVRQTRAMKLSAVNACVEIISNSMAKLPMFVMESHTKKHVEHPLLRLLCERPNEAMTPTVHKKLMSVNTLCGGNGYDLILRSPRTAEPVELLPIHHSLCCPVLENGTLWYACRNPKTGEWRRVDAWDMLHYKAYSEDGIHGISVLERARATLRTVDGAQRYEAGFYEKSAQPGGVLSVDGQLGKEQRDIVRDEWQKAHSGVDNAFRVAVLDSGMKYQPIGISNSDAQFVESKEVTTLEIARFFCVPPYKLGIGKQSYSSNEQNGIEYVTGTLHPIVSQCDEEDTYKLLFSRERAAGLEIRRNMMAELKGDTTARAAWYKAMREISVFSANDVRALEDLEDVPGGDTRNASLNYVPLELFEELSVLRAKNPKSDYGEKGSEQK